MAEYIEREAVLEIAMQYCPDDDGSCSKVGVDIREMLDEIEAIPAADVAPARHGHWIKSPECPEEYDICSVCGKNDKHRSRGNWEHDMVESVPPFCKWCGAKMDKDGNGDV